MTFNRFAAGRKVYGQGSFAPTKGQVNPQGYIKREIQRRNQEAGGVSKVGNDGQSDTRSGLAAKALNRGGSGPIRRPGQPQGVRTNANFGSQAVARGEGPRRAGTSAVGSAPGFQPGSASNSAGTSAPVSVGPDPASPSVAINPTGQLQLPYNSEFANMALDAQMQFDAENLALQQAEQEQALAYEQNVRDLDQGYVTQQRGTLNNNAASGTAFSSAYGVGVNEDSRNYNNMKNDLFSENELFKQGIVSQRNAASTRMQAIINRAVQAYTDSLAEEAGDLGFGTDEADVSDPSGAGSAPAPTAGKGGKVTVKGGNSKNKGNNNWLTPNKAGKNPVAVATNANVGWGGKKDDDDKKSKKGKK